MKDGLIWLTEFVDTSKSIQLEHIHELLDRLTSTDPDQRFTAARNVLYIAQGKPHSFSLREGNLIQLFRNFRFFNFT